MVTGYWSANFENLSLKGVNCPRMDVQTVLFGGYVTAIHPFGHVDHEKSYLYSFVFRYAHVVLFL